jgi:hypothetical protein
MCVTDNRSTPEELAKRRSSEADDILNKAHTNASRKASTSSTATAELDVFKKALTAAGHKVCVIHMNKRKLECHVCTIVYWA